MSIDSFASTIFKCFACRGNRERGIGRLAGESKAGLACILKGAIWGRLGGEGGCEMK